MNLKNNDSASAGNKQDEKLQTEEQLNTEQSVDDQIELFADIIIDELLKTCHDKK